MVGQLAGGWYGQELLRGPAHKRHHICYLMSLTTVLAILPLVLVINLPFRSLLLCRVSVCLCVCVCVCLC